MIESGAFGIAAAALVAVTAACASTAPADEGPAPTALAPIAPPPSLTIAALAVRQRAAKDFACDDESVTVTHVQSRGTLQIGHARDVWRATGCSKECLFVAVCVEDLDGGGACKAVPTSDDGDSKSPYAE